MPFGDIFGSAKIFGGISGVFGEFLVAFSGSTDSYILVLRSA